MRSPAAGNDGANRKVAERGALDFESIFGTPLSQAHVLPLIRAARDRDRAARRRLGLDLVDWEAL